MSAGQSPRWIFRSNEADRIAPEISDTALPSESKFRAITHPFPRCGHAARGSWSFVMDYAKPADVVASMIDASLKKLALAPRDLLIRGALSGALLGAATSTCLYRAPITTGPADRRRPHFSRQPRDDRAARPRACHRVASRLVPLARLERKATLGRRDRQLVVGVSRAICSAASPSAS